MECTLGKDCPIWGQIEALAKKPGFYETKCNESCAKFSKTYNTCIEMAKGLSIIQTNIGNP